MSTSDQIYAASKAIREGSERLEKLRKTHDGIGLAKPGVTSIVVFAGEMRIEVTEARYSDHQIKRGYEMLALGAKKMIAEEIAATERRVGLAAKVLAEGLTL